MTVAQRKALLAIKEAGGDMNWSALRRITHPWTRGSLLDRGWVEIWNHPHRDEVWGLTETGAAAISSSAT